MIQRRLLVERVSIEAKHFYKKMRHLTLKCGTQTLQNVFLWESLTLK